MFPGAKSPCTIAHRGAGCTWQEPDTAPVWGRGGGGSHRSSDSGGKDPERPRRRKHSSSHDSAYFYGAVADFDAMEGYGSQGHGSEGEEPYCCKSPVPGPTCQRHNNVTTTSQQRPDGSLPVDCKAPSCIWLTLRALTVARQAPPINAYAYSSLSLPSTCGHRLDLQQAAPVI